MRFTSHSVVAILTAAVMAASSGVALAAATYSVPGTSNPFLAGMPSGSSCCSGDSALAESPVFAGDVSGGELISFTDVTGGVSFEGGIPTDGPNGNAGDLVNTAAYEGGLTSIDNIAGYNNAPVDALVGVFLNSNLPTTNPTPAELDFATPTETPSLQQVFFIGNGSLGSITVPTGATRLFLGTVDGFGWNNNTGAIEVTVNSFAGAAPEPATWALMLIGIGGLGASLRMARSRGQLGPADA